MVTRGWVDCAFPYTGGLSLPSGVAHLCLHPSLYLSGGSQTAGPLPSETILHTDFLQLSSCR